MSREVHIIVQDDRGSPRSPVLLPSSHLPPSLSVGFCGLLKYLLKASNMPKDAKGRHHEKASKLLFSSTLLFCSYLKYSLPEEGRGFLKTQEVEETCKAKEVHKL